MFYVGKNDAGGDFLNALQTRQLLKEESFVGFDVLGNDAQQEIDIAEYQVTVQHLWISLHFFGESGKIAATV